MESSALCDCEVRAVIKFLNAEGVTRLEIHRRLNNVCGELYASLECDLGCRHFAMEENL